MFLDSQGVLVAEWWRVMNERRGELIHRKNREGLTGNEPKELEVLQAAAGAIMKILYPRPPLPEFLTTDEDCLRRMGAE